MNFFRLTLGRIWVSALLVLLSAQSWAGTWNAFGPKVYVRPTGSPVTVTDTFSVQNAATQYTLHLQNGGLQDDVNDFVSSTVITVNGVVIVAPNDLSQNVTTLNRAVQLQAGNNTIAVEVRGKPGGQLAVSIVGTDNDLPVIRASVSPAANAAAWNNTAVTVSFVCTDATSGVASCSAPVTVTTEGAGQVVSGRAVDQAGNVATVSVTLNIDETAPAVAPSLAPAANSFGWNNTNVTVNFACSDALSGVANCSSPVLLTAEGAGQTANGSATDRAGNTASAVAAVNIDKTPPTITATVSPVPAVNGTINAISATVSFTCADALSGLQSCPTPVTVTTTGLQTISGTASDNAGNAATASVQFTLQPFPPLKVIASATPAPNAAGWNNTPVTVTFQCTGGAPPVSCPGQQTVSTDGANQTIGGTATDALGGTATASVVINLDRTAPLLSITSPTDGSISPTPAVAVAGLASDALSGIAAVTCNGAPAVLVPGGFNCSAQIAQNGSVLILVQAADIAGNKSSSSITVNLAGPKLAITSPSALDLFGTSSITVTGTVDDPGASVTVNGVAASNQGGIFSAANVILREGNNLITATGINAGGGTGTATVNVVLDTTAPTVRIDSPSDKAVLTSPQITVSGLVNDIVTGTINSDQVKVTVNGVDAVVANRSFMASGVLLVPGVNVVTAVAKDRAGNQSQSQISITLQDVAARQKILTVSGNNQSAAIGTTLAEPLVVAVINGIGQPLPNVPVTFAVTKSDGQLAAFPQQGRQITLQSDGNGQVSVNLQVGTRVGTGNNQVAVTSPGFAGEVTFSASSSVGAPTQIHDISGETQRGIVGQPLPEPFVVAVFDAGGNPVPGIPVTFSVTLGGGTLEGTQKIVKTTDSDGRSAAVLVLAQDQGIDNNVVTASFDGLTGLPAIFTSSGQNPGNSANTRVTGIVLDNANQPIPNATASIQGTNLSALSDDKGQFVIPNAPIGSIVLFVDGATSSRPENFPFLEFPMVTVAGLDNNLGRPIYLPPLDNDNSKVVGGDEDVTLTMKGVPGVVYTVFAHSATFPDGSKVGRLTLSQVHSDKVPMIPPNGTAPRLVGTLQPARVKFDPPIRVQFPNTDGLPPGTVTEIFSFHHDLEQFVSEGTARVSEDGSVIVSDPGFGLTVSGWHGGGGPPAPPTNACNCQPDPSPCVTVSCNNSVCEKHRNIPDGQACHKVDIETFKIDHDVPSNSDYESVSSPFDLFGGSEDKTSDFFKLNAKTDPSVSVDSYTWSISGTGSDHYSAPTTQEWKLGRIFPVEGRLHFRIDVQFSDGETAKDELEVDAGVRTDDVAVIGWINPDGVPLDPSGIRSDVLRYFPPGGAGGMSGPQRVLTAGYMGVLAIGLPITPTVYELGIAEGILALVTPGTSVLTAEAAFALETKLAQLFGVQVTLSQADKMYILHWFFKYGGNPCSGRCPPNSFSDPDAIKNFQNGSRTSYKLLNRLQIDYAEQFNGVPFLRKILQQSNAIGTTIDPLFGLEFPGEAGPLDGAFEDTSNPNTFYVVNEGSPDSKGVMLINALASPLKWNDIGSRIAEGEGQGTGADVANQVYPTYNIYFNGVMKDQRPQAGDPIQNFNTNPFYITTPFGPAPFRLP